MPAPATCSRAWSAGSAATATRSACPPIGGELVFDECYRDNPLVNVFCLGTLPIDRLVLARAEGVGNLAVLLGASTGRDGIGGASVLASAGFEEGSEAKRPSVQVGDPFEEKKLIEACLALLDAGLGDRRAGPRRGRASRARRRRPRPRPARGWTSTSRGRRTANRG